MNWKRTAITWGMVIVVLFLLSKWMSPGKNDAELSTGPVAATMSSTSYALDQEVILKLQNNTAKNIELAFPCPKNPFRVMFWDSSAFVEKKAETKIDCKLLPPNIMEPGKPLTVTYTYWNHALFGATGRYKIEVPLKIDDKEQVFSTNEFEIKEKGTMRFLWDKFLYQPLFNLLIVLIKFAPFRDLGLAIIILTILVRLILLVPSQRAIEAQKRMQEVQPKLEEVKKKFAGNQERIAQETMALWKKEKVSPFGSCLPLVIQFPILIALFYVIRNGLNPDSSYMLYGSLKNIDFQSIHTNFLGILELTRINTFVLPLVIGLLQFFQMKLAIPKKQPASGANEMQQANKMMIYMMPVMIAFFTASVPAGVGLYWGVSTVFGIVQQMIANRGKITSP